MVCALAAIGLNTSFSDMKKTGIKPMIHGFIISALVVIVALLVEIAMGIVWSIFYNITYISETSKNTF